MTLRLRKIHQTSTRAAALALGASLLAAACGDGGQAGGSARGAERPTPAVEAVRARSGSLPLEERLNGVVKARNQVSVRPEITARVTEVLVRSGDPVRRGQPLVRLDDAQLGDQLRQAEAAVRLEQASARGARARAAEVKAQLVRARELAEQALIARVQLDTLEAQHEAAEAAADEADARVNQAEATLAERRSALGKTTVSSPLGGRVGRRAVEPGMIVDPSTLLFEVGSLDELQVEIPLTGEMLARVHSGSPVVIRSQALAGPLRAELSRISPFLAETSFSTTGEIDLPNPEGRLRPGMFVNVDVLYGESEQATLVPSSALWEDPRTGVRGAYVVSLPESASEPAQGERAALSPEAHAAAFRPLEIVAEGRNAVGVSGVKPGEWVVTVGQNLLHEQEKAEARVRPARWDAVLQLQGLQREDLLRGFLERQQRIAREHGAEPPTVAEFAGRRAAAQGD